MLTLFELVVYQWIVLTPLFVFFLDTYEEFIYDIYVLYLLAFTTLFTTDGVHLSFRYLHFTYSMLSFETSSTFYCTIPTNFKSSESVRSARSTACLNGINLFNHHHR